MMEEGRFMLEDGRVHLGGGGGGDSKESPDFGCSGF